VPGAEKGGGVALHNVCSKTQRPLDDFKNSFDPEDLCTPQSHAYVQLVMGALADANQGKGVPVHVVLSGHDHSLQLLDFQRPREPPRPPARKVEFSRLLGVQIVSGAGAKTSEVQASNRDELRITTNGGDRDVKRLGVSRSGWAQLRFEARKVVVTFHSGRRDITRDMAGEDQIELVIVDPKTDRLGLAPR
jgi:hypothetical protein